MKENSKVLLRLAQAEAVFYLLPALMLLLIAGTLAQRDMGLYDAHRLFFGSFIFMAGPVPLPGGYTLCGLLTLSLAMKFLLLSDWSLRKSGIILTHLGTLVLLGGGLMTALTAREGYMVIGEDQQTPFVYDYHDTQLSVFIGDNVRMDVPFANLQNKAPVSGLPFTIKILSSCGNCEITKREDTPDEFGETPLRGMAKFMALHDKPREKEAEVNLAGTIFEISGLDKEQDGIYIAFDAMPKPITLTHGKQIIRLLMGKSQRELPFQIKLNDFKKESYPGLEMARAYSSDVTVIDGSVKWPVKIEMNTPLRYKGYTFYQSSFDQTQDKDISILSVVENKGRLFPYIGTLIIAAGLLLHIFLVLRTRRTL